jgi:hypothetical protein
MEILSRLIVEIIHYIKNSVGSQDFMADVCHQQNAGFVSKNGGDKSWPHLQPED